MSGNTYTPPKVWQWEQGNGGKFANINRPISGATHDQELPVGKHPLQLYSLATPNGVKVTILLEELLAVGIKAAEYDAWLINIMEGEQFSSGFVAVNPNSKIPAMVDHSTNPPTRLFESGSMMLYLAEKFDQFIPKSAAGRTECLNWLFWQMASAPIPWRWLWPLLRLCAGKKYEYPINRYTMEVKRQLDVLEKQLANHDYIAGDEYTIADMAICPPWYGALVRNEVYEAAEFLDASSYKNVLRWAEEVAARPAVKRGRMVNKAWGEPASQLRERHDASDF